MAKKKEVIYDSSDPEQVEIARLESARKDIDRLQFVAASMNTEEGRAWFYELLVRCNIYSTPFRKDPYDTAFLCGEQNVGRMIEADIMAAVPDQYVVMVCEGKER